MLIILLSLLQAYDFVEVDEVANTKYTVTSKLMYTYSKPTTRSLPVGRLTKGQSIEGDKVEKHENQTWISYLEKNKARRYVIAKDQRGQCFVTPCPNATNVTRRHREREFEMDEFEMDEFEMDEFEELDMAATKYNVTSKLMYVYSRPTMRSLPVGRLTKGQAILGDKVEKHENLTWISFLEKNKTRRYVVAKDQRGQCFVTPCPNVTKTFRPRRELEFEMDEVEEYQEEYFFDEIEMEELDMAATKYNVTSKLMYVYTRPTMRSLPVGRLTKGQAILGDKVEKHENLTWISFLEKNKTRRYVVAKDLRGQCFVTPCPNVTTTFRPRRELEFEMDEFEAEEEYSIDEVEEYFEEDEYYPETEEYFEEDEYYPEMEEYFEEDEYYVEEDEYYVEEDEYYVEEDQYKEVRKFRPIPKDEEEIFEEDEYFDEEEALEEVSNAAYKVTSRIVNVYNKPSLRSPITGRLMKNHIIEADKIEKHENLTWVSYMSKNNKTRHYVIGKDQRGQCFVDPCPEVPAKGTEEWRRHRLSATDEEEIFEEDEWFDEEFDELDMARCGNNVAFLQNQFGSSCPAIKKSGCLFLAICYMGGCCTQQEVLNFWAWSVRNGKVRSSDAYIQVGTDSLVANCVSLYKFGRRPGSATTNAKRSHWWVVSGGKVVYNSVPGWF